MKLALVDGNAMAYRAFYKIPGNLSTSSGVPTNASYGFAIMFRKLFAGRHPTHGAVVFDPSGPTFRDEAYPDYKADRSPMPPALKAQLPWIRKVVEAFGFPHVTVSGFEADDVIGTLTTRARAAGGEVLIVSGDKDFAQLIGPSVRMLDAMRDITYDAELVRKKWGVPPEQFVDLLALLGDKIDNIPGVPGIGSKGAKELLEAHGSLDAIIQVAESLKGRAKKAIMEHADQARLSRDLATIRTNVELDFDLDALALPAPDPARQNALFRELEFFSLLSDEARADAETSSAALAVEVLSAPEAAARLERATTPVAVEPLQGPENHALADWVGCAFSDDEGLAFYVAFPEHEVPEPLVSWLENGAKICHDTKQLVLLAMARGVAVGAVQGDTMLGSFLVDPNKLLPHRLDQLSKELLQETLRPLKRLVGSGQSEVHPRAVSDQDAAEHAGHRAEAVLRCWSLLSEQLREEGQVEQLRERDIPLCWTLARMESHGILIDADDLARTGVEFEARLKELESSIHALAGRTFNIASTKQLSQVLFEELGLPVISRTKTGYSTKSEVLEKLAPDHEIAALLLDHRKLAKLISTYTNVLRDAVQPETGRIHANFQQTASQTGRLISTDPDLQRTPIRTAEGKRIRTTFIASPGHLIMSADWSQIELRILAHFSGDPLLVQSFEEGLDVHRRTAAQLFHKEPEEVSSSERNVGKTVNFATIYGQGATALGQILSVPRKEAQAYIDRYFETYAGVRAWLDATVEAAMEHGYVETMFGRRRYIPELSSHAHMEVMAGQRIAANTPIQGSAADICKEAMTRLDRGLTAAGLRGRLVMQIHDELVLEVPGSEVDAVRAMVLDVMHTVVKLRVPLVADVGVGASWADAH